MKKKMNGFNFSANIHFFLYVYIFFGPVTATAQKTFYIVNEQIKDEISVKKIVDSVSDILSKRKRSLKTIIYHRELRKDSILNYLSFSSEKLISIHDNSQNGMIYKQDSLYLLLNHKIPAIILKDLDQNDFSTARLAGKPALINFWSINCAPCIEEFGKLNYLKRKYENDFQFIGIVDDSEDFRIKAILKKHPFDFYILKEGSVLRSLMKIKSVPKNIFIDKNGKIKVIKGGLNLIGSSSKSSVNINDLDVFENVIKEMIKNKQIIKNE